MTLVIEGINLEKLLRSAQEEGIVLYGARRTGGRTMCVSIASEGRKRLETICQKCGWQVKEEQADWMLRTVRFFRKRMALVAACLICVTMVYASSKMILSVQIEHAGEHVAEVRRFLDEAGVHPGRFKTEFSLDDLRSRLALRLPGLAFVSFRYAGSTLIADCRPAVQGELLRIAGSALDIVAVQPGIITKIAVANGTPAVVPGQAVHRGQVLIRGEERTERGQTIPVQAQGQVTARVFASGSASVSMQETRTVETGQSRTRMVVKSPWHTRVVQEAEPFDSQDVSTEIQPVVGLYLPLWREKQTYAQTEVFKEERNKGDAASLAQGAAEEIAKKECPPGALILDKWVDYSMIDNEFMYATVVLDYEAPIAGRIQ